MNALAVTGLDSLRQALHDPWVMLGLLGEAVFMLRFVVQWLTSERAGRSHVPLAFWYLSLAGSVIVLVYAIRIVNIVFILGQSIPCPIYIRNLVLIHRERARLSAATRKP